MWYLRANVKNLTDIPEPKFHHMSKEINKFNFPAVYSIGENHFLK